MRSPLSSLILLSLVTTGSAPRSGRDAFHPPSPAASGQGAAGVRPIEEWTARFVALVSARDWKRLGAELEEIRSTLPELYGTHALGYLHARALIETPDLRGARQALEPFLVPGHPLRDLALHHRARIAEAAGDHEEAARSREELIFGTPRATYRGEDIADHLARLEGDASRLIAFASRLSGTLSHALRRQTEAFIVEALLGEKREAEALERGLRLLREGSGDDPAERVSKALDRADLLDRMGPEDWALIGQSLQAHWHLDRAAALLERALDRLPSRRDDLLFSIGRAHFGAEDYEAAERVYVRGATEAHDPEAVFLYHAARCAQLVGDDARAERYLNRTVAIPRSAGVATPRKGPRRRRAVVPAPEVGLALTQRLRLRVSEKRFAEAEADLRQLKRRFGSTDALRDGTLAYATAMIAAGRHDAALHELESVPLSLLRPRHSAEIDYWKGRALEAARPGKAVEAYLRVLQANAPTAFASFARQRLAGPLVAPARAERERLALEVERLAEAGDFEAARKAQTLVVLLSSEAERPDELGLLAALYRELPLYRDVLDLEPFSFPRLPSPAGPAAGRLDLLLALGLFDDAADLIPDRYPLGPPASALTRAEAFHLAGAPKRSIHAVEVLLHSVPDDFAPQLLPGRLRRLLYPFAFRTEVDDAQERGVDLLLVLAVMREESRFDPRAKSASAARGLLQLLITTARDVAREMGLLDVSGEDLYEPGIGVPLGVRYLADLLREFDGDSYKAVAAYNAGPKQVRLWSRMSAAPGEDAFVSSISFDETRAYVAKVLRSCERYAEIYGEPSAGP